jgi:GTP1/Obg family GTP-binding protein
VNGDVATPKNKIQQSVNRASTEREQRVSDVGCCIMYNTRAVRLHLFTIEVLAAFVVNMVDVVVSTPKMSVNLALTENQQSINYFEY